MQASNPTTRGPETSGWSGSATFSLCTEASELIIIHDLKRGWREVEHPRWSVEFISLVRGWKFLLFTFTPACRFGILSPEAVSAITEADVTEHFSGKTHCRWVTEEKCLIDSWPLV